MNYLGHSDSLLPSIAKPSLQGWDNYQIHDLYCDDIEYSNLVVSGNTILPPSPILFSNFLAVERVSPYGAIDCDFQAIALTYP